VKRKFDIIIIFTLVKSALVYKKYIHNERLGWLIFMVNDQECASCGTRLVGQGDVIFKCPGCDVKQLGRCVQCRDQSVEYICPDCGYEGP